MKSAGKDRHEEESAGGHDEGASSRLARWAWIFTLVAAVAGAYAVNVAETLGQIRNHNLRTLEQSAHAVEELVENARDTLTSLAKRPEFACEFFERQPRLTLIRPDCDSLQTIDAENISLALDPRTNELQLHTSFTRKPGADADGQSAETLVLNIELEQVLLDAPFGGTFDEVLIADADGQVVREQQPQRNSLFQPPGEDAMEPLFGFSVENLNGLRRIDTQAGKAGNDDATDEAEFSGRESATSAAKVSIAGTAFSLVCQPLRITLDESEQAPAADAGESTTVDDGQVTEGAWRLCGLADEDRSFRQSLELASPLVVAMFAIAILGLLGWPIFRILTVMPRERLRFVDVYLVLLATAAVLMVLTVLVLDMDNVGALRELSRNRLETLARQIDDRLDRELGKLYQQLARYDERAKAGSDNGESRLAAYLAEVRQDPDARPDMPESVNLLVEGNSGDADRLGLGFPAVYPYFTSIYWMRPCDGRQVLKATVGMLNTPAVTLGNRAYFQAVRDRHVDAGTYYVQTVTSITTGEFSAALASESRLEPWTDHELSLIDSECDSGVNPAAAVAVSTSPLSMIDPVLAPGVGFAVVDDSGRAVFHSDTRRATLETLLDDDGITRRLRAALQSTAAVHFHANYRARSHQVHVAPMKAGPWTIVTFADDEILRTSNLEILARASVLATFYLLMLALATLVYLALYRRDMPRWLWPLANWNDEQRIVFYRQSTWLMTVVTAAFALALRSLSGDSLLLVSLLVPAAVLCLTPSVFYLVMNQRIGVDALRAISVATGAIAIAVFSVWMFVSPADAPAPNELALVGFLILLFWLAQLRFRQWWRYPLRYYMVTALLLWCIVAILPAYGFFKLAHQSEMSLVSLLEEDFFARSVAQREQGLADRYRNIEMSRDRSEFLASAVADCGIYDASLSRTAASTGKAGAVALDTASVSTALWRWISHYQPIYNDTTSYARYRMASATGPTTTRPPAFATSGAAICDNGESPGVFVSPLAEPRTGWYVATGGIAILGLLWAWVVYGAQSLFFGELDARGATRFDTRDLVHHRIDRPVIAVIPSDRIYDQLTADDRYHRICDLSVALPDPADLRRSDKPVLCIRLERALQETAGRPAVISFLDVLVSGSHAPLVVSSSDPLANAATDEAVAGDGQLRHLVDSFEVRQVSMQGKLASGAYNKRRDIWRKPDKAWLQAEIGALDGLREALGPNAQKALAALATRREAIIDIANRADGYYRALWHPLSVDEKLVLIQLQEEAVINPRQIPAVRRLLRVGLLRMDPVLRPVNDSLGAFASAALPREEVRRLENVKISGASNKRRILMAIIVTIFLFLWFTQRNVVETWIAYLGAIAMSISGIFRFMGTLRKGGDNPA